MSTPRVLVTVADGSEELEAVTIIDILRRADIHVTVASLDGEIITASRGVRLQPDTDLDSALADDYDMVVLPGGAKGADRLQADNRVRELLLKMANSEKFIAAICAAPRVLASAGLLENRTATSYPGALDGESVRGMQYSDSPVVQDGRVITSRGPGTAMDFALKLVEQLTDAARSQEVERGLQRPR